MRLKLLQKGYRIWEIAMRIQRAQTTVNAALQADEELASRLRRKKTGRWSDIEDKYLLRLIGNLRKLDKEFREFLARRLGRTMGSVERRLKKLAAERQPDNVDHVSERFLDNDPSENEEAAIKERTRQIIEGLLKDDMAIQ